MTDPTPQPELTDIQRLAALDTYVKVLQGIVSDLRAAVTAQMGTDHAERLGAYLPDGTKVASITHSGGNRKAVCTDEEAAVKWATVNYPGEVVTVQQIRPAFMKKLTDEALKQRFRINPSTGQALDFIEVKRGSAYVTVSTTDEGVERMTALAHGFTASLEAGA